MPLARHKDVKCLHKLALPGSACQLNCVRRGVAPLGVRVLGDGCAITRPRGVWSAVPRGVSKCRNIVLQSFDDGRTSGACFKPKWWLRCGCSGCGAGSTAAQWGRRPKPAGWRLSSWCTSRDIHAKLFGRGRQSRRPQKDLGGLSPKDGQVGQHPTGGRGASDRYRARGGPPVLRHVHAAGM